MMHYLVAATAPDKRRVFQILHKFAIDQHVDEIDHLHLRGVEFIELVAGTPRYLSQDTLCGYVVPVPGYPVRFADAADRRPTARS